MKGPGEEFIAFPMSLNIINWDIVHANILKHRTFFSRRKRVNLLNLKLRTKRDTVHVRGLADVYLLRKENKISLEAEFHSTSPWNFASPPTFLPLLQKILLPFFVRARMVIFSFFYFFTRKIPTQKFQLNLYAAASCSPSWQPLPKTLPIKAESSQNAHGYPLSYTFFSAIH